MIEDVKKGSVLLKETLLKNGIIKMDEHEIVNDVEVSKLVNSGIVTVLGRVTYPHVLLMLSIPDEEISVLREVYKEGEIAVDELKGKIKLSRMKKWIETGLVSLTKREKKLFLIKK